MTDFRQPVIIGSGPSAVAAASALIARGATPVLIDGGLSATRDPDGTVIDPARGERGFAKEDPGAKTWFGSDFATREHRGSPLRFEEAITARASYAVGGLSRIWGGTFAFYSDYSAWPVGSRPSADDVAAVRALVPSSRTVVDEPARPGTIAGSSRSAAVRRAFDRTASPRWTTQSSRLAIDTREDSPHRCTLLGVCLNGCPRDSIWYAGDQVRRWRLEKRITHVAGQVVTRVIERDGLVEIHTEGSDGPATHTAPRVLLAAGPISSGAVLIASGIADSLVVRDTATAFTAIASVSAASEPDEHHGLSQWWAKASDGSFSAQIYPPDAGNVDRLAARIPGPFAPRALLRQVAIRVHPVIAYLDSDLSDALLLQRAAGGVTVEQIGGGSGEARFARYLAEFARPLLRAGYVLPVPATQFTAAGTGYHSGGTLPHGSASDDLGRPAGHSRLHVVDSSVLPRIEVGSITPTVMANAVRIARAVPLEEAA